MNRANRFDLISDFKKLQHDEVYPSIHFVSQNTQGMRSEGDYCIKLSYAKLEILAIHLDRPLGVRNVFVRVTYVQTPHSLSVLWNKMYRRV